MLVVKREQAMLALRYIDSRSPNQKQELQDALKQFMNKRQGRSR
jgi:hypothetical protein